MTRVGRFHPDSDDVALAFSFDCEGVTGEVYTRVRGERFVEHVHWLDDYSIAPAGPDFRQNRQRDPQTGAITVVNINHGPYIR